MTLQKYQERLATGKERLAELERHLKAELQTQCDVIKSVKESIAEQRNRLKLPTTFLGELDVLLEFGGGLAAAGDLPSGESVEKPAAAGDLPSGEGVENPAAAVATTGFVQNTPSF